MITVTTNNGTSATAETVYEAKTKAKRNALLADSDIYMIEDYPTDKKAEWVTYRKELRELPAAGTSKWNPSVAVDGDKLTLSGITWPTNVELALDTKYKDK